MRLDVEVVAADFVSGDADGPPVGNLIGSKRHRVGWSLFRQSGGDRIVGRGDDPAAIGHGIQELAKRLLDRGNVSEVVQMIRLDVGDDRDLRAQLEKSAIELVRLDDEKFTGAKPRAGANRWKHAAD